MHSKRRSVNSGEVLLISNSYSGHAEARPFQGFMHICVILELFQIVRNKISEAAHGLVVPHRERGLEEVNNSSSVMNVFGSSSVRTRSSAVTV